MRNEASRRARGGKPARRRARRPFIAFVARTGELFYLAQGLVVAVILSGMLLILMGLAGSLMQFSGDLSALLSEEGPQPVALAGTGGFEWPSLPWEPTAAPGTMEDGAGFVPLEIAVEWENERAPVLPVTGQPEAAELEVALPVEPAPYSLHLPMVQFSHTEDTPGVSVVVVERPGQTVRAVESPPRVMPPPAEPDQIIIPNIGLEAPVDLAPSQAVEVRGQIFQQWRAPDYFAAGWQQGSALAGAAGNTVITGHHNINGEVFRRLHELEQGDDVFLRAGENAYNYKVSQVMIFEERGVGMQQRQENARWILDSDDTRLTLVTCWPPDSNTHRLIVVAVPNP